MRYFLLVCLAFSFSFSGCGRKGDPRPPELLAPASVALFRAEGAVDGVNLAWKVPEKDVMGNPLRDLAGFVVRRAVFVPEERLEFKEIAEIDVDLDKEEDVLKKDFAFFDKDVEAGMRYEYLVFPVNEDNVEGPASSLIRVKFIGESSVIENR